MTKKVILVILMFCLSFMILSGCERKKGKDLPSYGNVQPNKNADGLEYVTIKTVSMFGRGDSNLVPYNEILTEFQEKYDYITVKDSSQASDEEWKSSIAADFSVGNEPDVLYFFTDATANHIVATDKFVTIEEIRKEYPDYAKDITQAALESTKNTDGIQRAVPTTAIWEGLYCNKDLFDQYEIELPTDWETFQEAITQFNKVGIVPLACSLSNVPHYIMEFCMLYASGNEIYESIPETAPIEWVNGLLAIKELRDIGAFPSDTDTVNNDYVMQLFKDKKAAMILDGSWILGSIPDQENTVVIPFPGISNQKVEPGAMVSGFSSGFYITRKAWNNPNKRDAAVKYVMAHTSKEANQRYWESGGAVSQAATAVEPIEGMSPLALSALDYIRGATSTSLPTDARIDSQAYKILINGIVKVSMGANAEDLINEALTLNNERR